MTYTHIHSQLKGGSNCYPTFVDSLIKVEKHSMTSITPRLNCSYRHRDGRYPVVIQVIRHRCKREIDTSLLLWQDEFNPDTCQAVSHPSHHRVPGAISDVNRQLSCFCAELRAICDALYSRKGESYTAADISDSYKRRRDLTQLFVYADTLIGTLHNLGRSGTAGNYRSACNAFGSFLGSDVLSFSDFTSDLVDRFVEHQKLRGKQPNTISCYLKQLRALYNKALRENVVRTDLRPFRNQTIREEPTRKRALSKEHVQRLEKADLTGCHKDVVLVRDLFMASFHLRGMAFVDLCYLRKENLEGDYLCYRRRKTGQALRVRIEKPLKELLSRYADSRSAYLFPMLRDNNGDEYRAYLNAKGRLGRRIHELGIRLHFEFPLSFHVARHTWATLAHNAGIELSVISSCLGHLSEKTTRIYLAGMDPKKLDHANRVVLNLLR